MSWITDTGVADKVFDCPTSENRGSASSSDYGYCAYLDNVAVADVLGPTNYLMTVDIAKPAANATFMRVDDIKRLHDEGAIGSFVDGHVELRKRLLPPPPVAGLNFWLAPDQGMITCAATTAAALPAVGDFPGWAAGTAVTALTSWTDQVGGRVLTPADAAKMDANTSVIANYQGTITTPPAATGVRSGMRVWDTASPGNTNNHRGYASTLTPVTIGTVFIVTDANDATAQFLVGWHNPRYTYPATSNGGTWTTGTYSGDLKLSAGKWSSDAGTSPFKPFNFNINGSASAWNPTMPTKAYTIISAQPGGPVQLPAYPYQVPNFTIGGLPDSGAGGVPYWNGTIGEVLIYDKLLRDADRAVVEAYLADKWGITVTVNAGWNP
ncbi:MAG TPA: hypothetical protein VGL77_10665 [Armatimonadota bacterium]